MENTKTLSYEVQDFQADVLEASRTTPVVVDFWAPWCGPCRVLGPVLERLAEQSEGAWRLVKVNTDVHPELSVEYGIRGIPAVKLFAGGAVVDEFTGALPEYAVRQWLEKALPSESKQRVEQAEAMLGAGDAASAEALLQEALAAEPDNPKARILMAQVLAFRDLERAAALVRGAAFAGPAYVQIGEAVEAVARLLSLAGEPERLPEGPGREAYLAALQALQGRDFDTALDRFIQVIQTDRYYDDDGARKACVALFLLLGEEHPATLKHRRLFNMALY